MNSGVISGMRASCDIVVRVDVVAAIAAGMVRACPGAGAEREWAWERGCERERERERAWER